MKIFALDDIRAFLLVRIFIVQEWPDFCLEQKELRSVEFSDYLQWFLIYQCKLTISYLVPLFFLWGGGGLALIVRPVYPVYTAHVCLHNRPPPRQNSNHSAHSDFILTMVLPTVWAWWFLCNFGFASSYTFYAIDHLFLRLWNKAFYCLS
jgi:hypothetical protein